MILVSVIDIGIELDVLIEKFCFTFKRRSVIFYLGRISAHKVDASGYKAN